MNPYFELLQQIGIDLDPCEWEAPESNRCSSPTLPNRPHHYTPQGCAVFTTAQLSWAHPEDFGFDGPYQVVEEEHSSHPLALNWSDERLLIKRRPVHRYNRPDRFKFTLAQLMGCSGDVPDTVLALIPNSIYQCPKQALWETVRSILKKHHKRLYYNRIPAILARLKLVPRSPSSTRVFQLIVNDFKKMHQAFPTIKNVLGRVYFPNLRYIAVRLMDHHGLQLPFVIPKTRTVKKKESLDAVYDTIWEYIMDQEVLELEAFFKDDMSQ